jgi:hypothetical protein
MLPRRENTLKAVFWFTRSREDGDGYGVDDEVDVEVEMGNR